MDVVVDTNILVGAMLRGNGAAREIVRLCLQGHLVPLFGVALALEVEDVLSRDHLFENSVLGPAERKELLAAILSSARWIPIYYTWRPNVRDEGDNHLVELAVAGNASYIITQNVRDFASMELLFPELRIVTAAQFLAERRSL